MKFVVELRLNPNSHSKVSDAYRRWHPGSDPGVFLRGARIGLRNDVLFIVSETEDEQILAEACRSWDEHGTYQIHPISDAE